MHRIEFINGTVVEVVAKNKEHAMAISGHFLAQRGKLDLELLQIDSVKYSSSPHEVYGDIGVFSYSTK